MTAVERQCRRAWEKASERIERRDAIHRAGSALAKLAGCYVRVEYVGKEGFAWEYLYSPRDES